MKKRMFALMMAVMMCASCSVVTMAEETEAATEAAESEEIVSVDYSMIDETVYEGTWVSAFNVFDLYLPSDWDVLVNVDLETEEAPENGVYFQAASEDQTRSAAISYAQSELTSLEELAAFYEENGFEEVGYMIINEIPVVTYSLKQDGVETAGIVTLGDQGGIYNVTVGCAEGDEEFSQYAQNIICSFSATETEAETEAE